MKTIIYPKIIIEIFQPVKKYCSWGCKYLSAIVPPLTGFGGECRLFYKPNLAYNKKENLYKRCKECRESKTNA